MDGAKLKAEALKIQSESDLTQLCSARDAELRFLQEQSKMEVDRSRQMNRIETEKVRL